VFALIRKLHIEVTNINIYSGGISIKGSAALDEMRADMMGAACVLASAHAISKIKGYCF
jgi:hypothetical protein